MTSKFIKIFLSVFVIWACLCAAAVFYLMGAQARALQEISYDRALQKMESGAVTDIYLRSSTVELTDRDDGKFVAVLDKSDAMRRPLLEAAQAKAVEVKVEMPSDGTFLPFLLNVLPFLIVIGTGVFLLVGLFLVAVNFTVKNAIKTALSSEQARPGALLK